MNQAILFNDDLHFNKKEDAWCFTGQLSGEHITIFFHSMRLKQLSKIDNCTQFDLEEIAEQWLENNDMESSTIHIQMK